MGVIAPRRAVYRVQQFIAAVAAYGAPLQEDERAEALAWLPETAQRLFDRMPRNDQRHSLNVLRALVAAGHTEPALLQAALLHDVAKSMGGVTLLHRIAIVLIKAARPDWPASLADRPAPARNTVRYPFWVVANHPRLGAEVAAEAGCDVMAVTLIRRHQEMSRRAEGQVGGGARDTMLADRLLAALQAADGDN